MVSRDQIVDFERDGYLVLPGFYSDDECDTLRQRMDELLSEVDVGPLATVFSSSDQAHAQDEYFMTSGDKVRVFFESEALAEDGQLIVPLDRALNKVGHAMHDLDPVFSEFSRKPALAALAGELGIVSPLLLQSMYIFKQPRIGGEVTWHTDHTFLWTEPQSVLGFWVALEDATEENGCLHCLPGSHRVPVKSRFRRVDGGAMTEVYDPEPYDEADAIPLPVDRGTLIVLHGTLAHWSAPNRSNRSRHAYTLHVIDGEADYPADNWLQRPEMPLVGF